MRDVVGVGANKKGVPVRPGESVEHPDSGQPLHDMTGGNAWVCWVLASAVPGSPKYDAENDLLLNAGPATLTLDLSQGEGIDPVALFAGVDRVATDVYGANLLGLKGEEVQTTRMAHEHGLGKIQLPLLRKQEVSL